DGIRDFHVTGVQTCALPILIKLTLFHFYYSFVEESLKKDFFFVNYSSVEYNITLDIMSEGLYRSEFEHDACGIGAVVNVKGNKSHETISDALLMLSNMEHRGGRGSDPKTGDGAGILIQMPHAFLKDVVLRSGFSLPEEGSYGVGMTFFPRNKQLYKKSKAALNEILEELDFELIGYRE